MLTGVEDVGRNRYNWDDIEDSLGLTLPHDYKKIAETFPQGLFGGVVKVIRPGDAGGVENDFPGYYGYRLDDMRNWREDESGRFPLPIFPEPGGLLPWGVSPRAGLFFWVTDGPDPTLWPVVAAEPEFERWVPFDGGVCDFLVAVVSGSFESRLIGVPTVSNAPGFQSIESAVSTAPEPVNAGYWEGLNRFGARPTVAVGALNDLIGSPGEVVKPVDWQETEQALGATLPSDYKAFIETYGPGEFGDITIVGPTGDRDLVSLRAKLGAEVSAHRRPGDREFPVNPDVAGVIAWGETQDGWACCWAPTVGDPDEWGTVLVDMSRLDFEYQPSLSFSAFLVRYANPAEEDFFIGRGRQPTVPIKFRRKV